MNVVAFFSLGILFISAFYIQSSLGVGFHPPIQFPFNDSSITVFSSNIIDQKIFVTTNRNGLLHLELFQVVGTGSEASLSLIETNNLGLNVTEKIPYLASFTDSLAVVGFGTGTVGQTIIFEKNTTNNEWEIITVFNIVTRIVEIIDTDKIFYLSSNDWSSPANSFGLYLKDNDIWIVDEHVSIPIQSGAYKNGIFVASQTEDRSLRIYEQINGTFTEMQHILVQDEVAIVQWGVKMFFTNDNELYLCHIDIVNGIQMYMHKFVKLANGTWEEERVIYSNYVLDWMGTLYDNIIVGAGYDATITRALFLIDMNDFNGTNSVTTLNFQYSQFLPLDGAMDTSSQRFFSVLDSDKNLVFFEVNPTCRNGVKEDFEKCDSGSNCNSFCVCSTNFTRSINPTTLDCVTSCGNGYYDHNELCDAYFVDTCRTDCTCQSGFESTGNTTCRAVCGNGVFNKGESCDTGIDVNCDVSCVGCKTGFSLVDRICVMDGVQAPFAMPEYVIPVAIVVPVVVAAGVVVLVALLVKKRNERKKRDREDEPLGDPKYISMATTQNSPNTSNAIKQLNSIPTENKLEVSHKDVILKHEIGAGAFGKVFIGEWQKVTVALKFSSVGNTEEFKQEAKLMIDLRSHPNVVQVLGLSLDGPFPILILEYCDGGSLESSVNKTVLTLAQIIDYAFGIARGMLHLHLNNIVHRDLAARNVLLDDGVPKISDFGMARFVEQYKEGKTGNTVGPLNWMSPESLLHQTYSVKSDMWSFGCVLFELVSGKLYDGMQPVDVYHGVTRGQLHPSIPDNAPPVIKFIMSKCFEFNPDNRPTFEEVCQWLREPLLVQTSNPLHNS